LSPGSSRAPALDPLRCGSVLIRPVLPRLTATALSYLRAERGEHNERGG
jgi:hypothetical protein